MSKRREGSFVAYISEKCLEQKGDGGHRNFILASEPELGCPLRVAIVPLEGFDPCPGDVCHSGSVKHPSVYEVLTTPFYDRYMRGSQGPFVMCRHVTEPYMHRVDRVPLSALRRPPPPMKKFRLPGLAVSSINHAEFEAESREAALQMLNEGLEEVP